MWHYSDIRKKAWTSLTEGSAINAVLATLIYMLIISVPLTILIMLSFIGLFVSGAIYAIPSDIQLVDLNRLVSGGVIVFIGIFILLILLFISFGIFVIAPLTVGYNRYLINIVRKNPSNGFGVIFHSFKKGRYMTQVAGMFAKDLRIALWSVAAYLVLYTPLILLTFFSPFVEMKDFSEYNDFFVVMIPIILIVFMLVTPILSFVWLFRCIYSYRFTEFIIAEYDGLQMTKAVYLSTRLTKGIRFRLFVLNLSFSGWFLLSYITSGLLIYWITPYITTAFYKVYCIQKSQYPELFEGMTPSADERGASNYEALAESVTGGQ